MKQSFRLFGCLLITVLTVFISPISFAAGEPIITSSLAPMLKKVMPAVVNIRAQIKVTDLNTLKELQKRRPNLNPEDDQQIPNTFMSVASGVIVDGNKGLIITNAHVIADAQNITVTLSDGHHYTAKTLGIDKPSDIALLQINAKNLTAVHFTDSKNLKVGDFVAAIGNPFGLSQTVTSGIVSALGRSTLGIETYENFIQTDTPINPGNSGGALIDMNGDLVGINTAILATERGNIGIGFAIPANMVKIVMNQLIEYGNVKRGLLGVSAQDLTPDLATAFNYSSTNGAAISQVLPNSPAANAGIKVGDIITAINNNEIKNANDVVNTIGFVRVDSKAQITVSRQNKPITMTVTLTDPTKRKELNAQKDPFFDGVGLKNFTLLSPIHGDVHGVLVVSVEADTNAWRSDLRPGDVITSLNQKPVKNITELQAGNSTGNKSALVNVLRGPAGLFLVIGKES